MRRSIVTLSEIKAAGFRADPEYWHPDYIANSALVPPDVKIRDCVVAAVPNIKSAPLRRDFRYLEIANISVSSGEYRTVPVAQGSEPDRAHYILQPDDVAVSTVRPNRNAVAFIRDGGIVGSSGLCVLRSKDLEPEYLFAFCKTDYLIKCLTRANKASMYPAVSNKDVLDTPIFTGSPPFREFVSSFVASAMELQDYAGEAYDAAESTLMAEVGLDEWQPSTKNWSIRMFSEIQAAGRMDAEYFLPKYDEITDAIKDYAGGWDTLASLVNIRINNFVPNKDTLYKYIEISNISQNGEISDCTVAYGSDLPSRARRRVSAGDVIVSYLEGSSDRIAIVKDEYDGALCSTGFYVVNSPILDSETLLLLLKSPMGQLQLKRGSTGTILTAISSDELGKIVLPLVADDVRTAIQRAIAESQTLRQLSRQLLDTARRGVEIAIEQGEPAAMAWLEAERAALL